LEVKAAARASASLDQPVGEQEDAVFGDFVAGDDPLPEEEVEVSLRSQALTAALAALHERERQVLVLRYGLDDSEPKTLEEIGRGLGRTGERGRQIEREALRRLASLREMQPVTAYRPERYRRTATAPAPRDVPARAGTPRRGAPGETSGVRPTRRPSRRRS